MTEADRTRKEPTAEDIWAARRTSFGSAADNYAYGRPHYPRAAIEWALPAGARTVVDVGAGTGRLTETLLDLGLHVTWVEPSDEMRAHIPATATTVAAGAEERTDQTPEGLLTPFDPTAEFPEAEVSLYDNGEDFSIERITAYALSPSAAILLPPEELQALTDRLRAALPTDGFTLAMPTECWRSLRS